MNADLSDRIDARLLAEREDVLAASAQVTDAYRDAVTRYHAARDEAAAAWARFERRKTSLNHDTAFACEDRADRAQDEVLRLGAESRRLAARFDLLADPAHRRRLIDRAQTERERREAVEA